MTNKAIVAILRKHKPTTEKEIRRLFPDATSLGAGCFREAFHVANRVVIKIPLGDENGCDLLHSRREIRNIRKIQNQKRYRHLRRYIPKIFMMDYKRGILVSELLGDNNDASAELVLHWVFSDTFQSRYGSDVCGNTGRNGRGHLKVLDLGCV